MTNVRCLNGAGAQLRRLRFTLKRSLTLLVSITAIVSCRAPDSGMPGDSAAYQRNGKALATMARDQWVADIDSLMTSLVALDSAAAHVDGSEMSIDAAQQKFRAARLAFKRVEFAIAYYEPSTTAGLNGAALPRVEYQDGPEVVFPPEGLQVIEEWLYTGADTARRTALVNEIRNAQNLARRARTAAAAQLVTDNRVWDASVIEVARVSTLGIVGFDSPIAQHSIPEAAAALRGVRSALSVYKPEISAKSDSAWNALDAAFANAIAVLDTTQSFANFDRLGFIVNQANVLARGIQAARTAIALTPPGEQRVFSATAGTIFDALAVRAQGFTNPMADADTPAQVVLGEHLFFDERLAGDAKQSCASCHEPERSFTDGRVRSVSRVDHAAGSMRNTPTIINAGLQNALFADQRAAYLEDQVEAVLNSPNEMHSSSQAVAVRLRSDSVYLRMFTDAFKGSNDSVVTSLNMRRSIAAYIRSLNATNSRADDAMRGDLNALTDQERRGFNLYAGKGKCATCHFIPLFNGAVPPNYRSSDVEVLGVPTQSVTKNATVDPDSGRFRITRAAPHLFAFKTPGLRNVALTAPYMHNGVYRTLEEVVDFYNRGGGKGIGIVLENQTLPFDSLQLTVSEQRDIVAFMHALTDTTSVPLKRMSARPAIKRVALRP